MYERIITILLSCVQNWFGNVEKHWILRSCSVVEKAHNTKLDRDHSSHASIIFNQLDRNIEEQCGDGDRVTIKQHRQKASRK